MNKKYKAYYFLDENEEAPHVCVFDKVDFSNLGFDYKEVDERIIYLKKQPKKHRFAQLVWESRNKTEEVRIHQFHFPQLCLPPH